MLLSTEYTRYAEVRYSRDPAMLLSVHHNSVQQRYHECLERQPSRFINIVGKDDTSRQGEKARQVERFRDIYTQSECGAAATSHAPSVFIPQPYC
jgi:hypothetical protein